jgi:hypothetical protein
MHTLAGVRARATTDPIDILIGRLLPHMLR